MSSAALSQTIGRSELWRVAFVAARVVMNKGYAKPRARAVDPVAATRFEKNIVFAVGSGRRIAFRANSVLDPRPRS
jgi:hypothetical protein